MKEKEGKGNDAAIAFKLSLFPKQEKAFSSIFTIQDFFSFPDFAFFYPLLFPEQALVIKNGEKIKVFPLLRIIRERDRSAFAVFFKASGRNNKRYLDHLSLIRRTRQGKKGK